MDVTRTGTISQGQSGHGRYCQCILSFFDRKINYRIFEVTLKTDKQDVSKKIVDNKNKQKIFAC